MIILSNLIIHALWQDCVVCRSLCFPTINSVKLWWYLHHSCMILLTCVNSISIIACKRFISFLIQSENMPYIININLSYIKGNSSIPPWIIIQDNVYCKILPCGIVIILDTVTSRLAKMKFIIWASYTASGYREAIHL